MSKSTFLVVATSGRAIAQGLKALDHAVVVIDGFADQDTIAATDRCKKVKRTRFGLDEKEVLDAVQELQTEYAFAGLFYDAALEANPKWLDKINVDVVIGNSGNTLLRCKDPDLFFSTLEKHRIAYPESSFNPSTDDFHAWLLKHKHSSGGVGVRSAFDNEDESESFYLQKMIEGTSFSITFLAAGEEIQVLGANTQWSECLSESLPYAYAGAINQVKLNDAVITTAVQQARTIAKAFDLIGLNSIDYICSGNDLYVLEVNPRIPATYALYETKQGDVMREHIHVCKTRILPAKRRAVLLRAHAIVYAPDDIRIPAAMNWPLWTADRPHSGEKIQRYKPVCSVFSGGKNRAQVCEMITIRKRTILGQLERWTKIT